MASSSPNPSNEPKVSRQPVPKLLRIVRRPCAKQIHKFTIEYSAPDVNRHTWFDAEVSCRVGVYLHSNVSLVS